MKLEAITINNFRTLENVSVKFDGYYTAISGQNNAGKTSLLRTIRHVLKDNSREYYYPRSRDEIAHTDDRTQWVDQKENITLDYCMSISRIDDIGLFQFVEKFNGEKLADGNARLRLKISHTKTDVSECCVWVNDKEFSTFDSKEILQKLKSSTLAFMHDSAHAGSSIYGRTGRSLHELVFTADELKQIGKEINRIQTRVKKISKSHKTALSELLGHLEEKYEVDFSIPEGMFSGSIPFTVNLRDKNVDIPLSDWGNGTQNRTQIMMSFLYASRIKSKPDENKITPLMIIEEPESFLHPSAQAEFGRVLIDLANELKIQTIVTTHSPYMLCQKNIKSNVLLQRRQHYGRSKETEVIEASGDNWMEPFSKILGLDNAEFTAWKNVLFSEKDSVLLVEGFLDKGYIEHINSLKIDGFLLPKGVEIVTYEGKDSLKNVILLKFIIDKFKKTFVTFDLDAINELEKTMTQVGLPKSERYLAMGIDRPGKQRIEGLLPDRIISKVSGENSSIVLALSSGDSQERKSAKNQFKQKCLEAFKADTTITKDDLKPFQPLFRALNKMCLNNA